MAKAIEKQSNKMKTKNTSTPDTKLRFLYSLLFIFLIALPLPAGASKKSDGNQILAIGTSVIRKENLAKAKKNAISQALMKGIEDYLVRRLGSEGMVNNFQRLVHEIIPVARENIENFHILAEDQTGDVYKILVRLKINKKVIDEKLRRAGLVSIKGPATKMLFMISEADERGTRYWWKYPEDASAMSSIELALHNAFQDRGFSPINRRVNIPEAEFSEDMRSSDLSADAILTWGKLFSADVVICGRTKVMDEEDVSLTLKAIDVIKGSLIYQGMHIEPILKDPEGNAQMIETLKRLVNHLAIRLTPAIVKAAGPARKESIVLEATLTGLKTYRQFIDFRNFLRKDVTGVKSVKQTRVRKNSISFEIEFEGDGNKFLERVMNHENLPLLLDFNRTEDEKIIFEVQ
ncbi:MAG: hypothetical protein JRJ15_00455 [Deltaproteobacteria bacterium]|nr:hypothetical protein [Deltaproteobacteria bacterium]